MNLKPQKLAAILTLLATWFGASQAVVAQSWQFDPYNIMVWVALDGHGDINAENWHTDIGRRVKRRSYAMMGSIWRLKVNKAPKALRSDIVQVPELLDAAHISETFNAQIKDHDKVFVVGVKREIDGYLVRVRELDIRTRQLGRLIEQHVGEARRVPDTVAALTVKAFTPLVRLEAVRGKEVNVRLRSGGLIVNKESPAAVGLGDTIRVVIRRNDRAGRPKRIDVIPWTILLVEDVQSALLTCHLHSGLHGVLQRGGGSRTLKLGLKVKPVTTSTVISVMSKREPRFPLAGYEIYAKDPEMPQPKSKDPEDPAAEDDPMADDYVPKKPIKIGVTDWRGQYVVKSIGTPLRVLYVKSGRRLLARMPLVPGANAREEVFLRSDDERIQAESFVYGIKSTAMDLVIQRFDLIARIRFALRKKDKDRAQKLLEELQQLPNAANFNDMLNRGERKITSSDTRMQGRITKLFNDTRTLLDKYLNPQTVDGVANEVATGVAKGPDPTKKKKKKQPANTKQPSADSKQPGADNKQTPPAKKK